MDLEKKHLQSVDFQTCWLWLNISGGIFPRIPLSHVRNGTNTITILYDTSMEVL